MQNRSFPRSSARFAHRRAAGFSRMELLVVLAILLVLGAIGHPIYKVFKQRAGRLAAQENFKKLGAAFSAYTGQHDGGLPDESSPGHETWINIGKPEAKNAWFNALPPLAGARAAGDLAQTPTSFYSKENLVYLSGANYPNKKRMIAPLFAIAFNTKLERKDEAGVKEPSKVSDIKDPTRTVLLFERGLLNEHRTLSVQDNGDYDGACKGSAKNFVGRYEDKGFICFVDGHADLFPAKEMLTETGQMPFPPTSVVWSRSPEENPNKVGNAHKAK